jgi:hypothetical protein
VVARFGRALTGMIDSQVEAVEGIPAEGNLAEGNLAEGNLAEGNLAEDILAEGILAEGILAEGSEDKTTLLFKAERSRRNVKKASMRKAEKLITRRTLTKERRLYL